MKPEHQRIAIAEFCGWIEIELVQGKPYGIEDSRLNKHPMPLPNYPLDLNAMHEAEKMLTPEQREEYGFKIVTMFGCVEAQDVEDQLFNAVNLDASQRSEAFCRTIGKWEE